MASADDIQAAKIAATEAAAAAANLGSEHQIYRGSTAQKLQYATSVDQIPAGAVRLSKSHVAEVTSKTIDSWQPKSEMWSVRYGPQALGALAGVTGFVFISHFRSSMLLRSHARFASLIPTVFFPGIVASTSQLLFVINPMLSGDIQCPVCLQTRSMAIQVLGGVIQPFILSIIASSALARTANTYALPPITDWRPLFSTYARMTRPIYNTVLSVLLLGAGSAYVFASAQGRAVNKVHKYLIDNEVFIT